MTRFKNKKNGTYYIWLAAGIDATNSRDGTPVVVYSPESNPNMIFVREQAEFDEKFEMVTETK